MYYELAEKRQASGVTDTAILRVEQFYPFAEALLKSVLAQYPSASRFYWVQEEPENMGGWNFIQPRLKTTYGQRPCLYRKSAGGQSRLRLSYNVQARAGHAAGNGVRITVTGDTMTELKIPEVGESVQEALLAQWLKREGESVRKDDILFVIETDKVTLEISAPVDGILKILVPEGETVKVGTVVGQVEEAAGKDARDA